MSKRCNNIRLPLIEGSISPLSGDAQQQTTLKVQEKPVLRFPSFDVQYNSERKSVYDYESCYESCSAFSPPEISRLKAGVSYYKAFTSCSPGDIYFWNRLKNASDGVIYFVDTHFDEKNLGRLIWICNDLAKQTGRENTEIIIITSGGGEFSLLEKSYKTRKNIIIGWKNVSLSICRLKNANYLHDRFVLFDNSIWHFGASAGGMHAGLNAYSGPWEDCNGGMRDLLQTVVKDNGGCSLCV